MRIPLLAAAWLLAASFASAAPLHVLASFLPIYAHAKTIAGDRADVQVLVTGDSDPHEFAPKPSDIRKIAGADLLVVNGVGMEGWLDATVKAAGSAKLVVVDASAGIPARANPTLVAVPGLPAGEAEAGANPHTWLDPVLAQQQVKTILAALQKADPANAAYYQANADAYLAQLAQLDADFRALFEKLPASSKNLITFHDAFPYFAARYGLNYLGSIEEFPEKTPSPRQLAHLVDLIKANGVKVLFAEEGYEPKLLRTIAAQTGAAVSEIDTLEVGAPAADAYLVRMRANLAALHKAWQ